MYDASLWISFFNGARLTGIGLLAKRPGKQMWPRDNNLLDFYNYLLLTLHNSEEYMKLIGILLIATLASGCATKGEVFIKDHTSGLIGCPAEEVKILKDSGSISWAGDRTWTASCKNKTFYCSAAPGEGGKCKEALQ